MKLLLSVIVLLVMSVIAANATNASEEKKEFLHPEYEWVVSEGKPCMVVFEPKKNARIRKTYCFNKEGVLAALLREELDSPASTRPIIARWLYAFDKYYNVVGIKKTSYRYGDGGKVESGEALHNNLATLRSEQIKYRDGILVSVSPAKEDGKGNWLIGYSSKNKSEPDISRKIYYYGDDRAMEAKTNEILAEADSLVQYCKSEAWSLDERISNERKSSHGLWWNVLLPALISALLCYVSFRVFYRNRKVSNTVIMLVPAIAIYAVGNYFIIPMGPYGALWTFLYWVISFIVGAYLLNTLLAVRCPRCASYNNATRIASEHRVRKRKEVATYEDGHKEVLSSSTEHTYTDTYMCDECGCTWRHIL